MKKIFFGGIHGVGKSTVIKELLNENKHIGHYSFGENVRDIGKNVGILTEYKDLAKIDASKRNILMDTARKRFEYTIEQELYDILLIDNHFSVYQNQELVRAIDDEELALYDKFILMEVPSDTLYQRVVNDKKERIMETFDIQKIIKHSEYERAVAFDFKHRFNIELLTLENVNLDDTITKIKNFIYEDTNSFKF